ncbi:MAG: HAD-IIIC family phosphatase [Longimicrobiales bacterium]
MKYLEALRISKEAPPAPSLPIQVAMSGTADLLEAFLQAHASLAGFRAEVSFLPFNTLRQALHGPAGNNEVVVLFPWDFVAALDWRSGLPERDSTLEELFDEAHVVGALVGKRPKGSLLYVPAPIPPVLAKWQDIDELERGLLSHATEVGANVLDGGRFSLSSYLASGTPFGTNDLSAVARAVVEVAIELKGSVQAKVLVTDLDGTLWHGVVGEDGVDGLQHDASGIGFRHFIYQTYLKQLTRRGILVAAVSRNDPDLANAPFDRQDMVLERDDLTTLVASYHAKSSQISQLAEQLNLSLDAFVFVDDNPVELEEVSTQLPQVDCVAFPEKDRDLPGLLAHLARRFSTDQVTEEDRTRTALYRRRLEGLAPSELGGADLTSFLAGLEMKMTVQDHSAPGPGSERARQLINKTNQFNLNGIRWTDEEIDEVLRGGGQLLGATVEDRSGTHGEVVALLIDGGGCVRSFVMSCRVFQRRIEYAFLAWLLPQRADEVLMDYHPTERNAPFQAFIREAGVQNTSEGFVLTRDSFMAAHTGTLDLFRIAQPTS